MKGRKTSFPITDAFGWLGILLWIALSLVALFNWEPVTFARLGSFGVAVFIAYFAFIPRTVPIPFYQIKSEQLNASQMLEVKTEADLASRNVSIVALEFARDLAARNRHITDDLKEIAANALPHLKVGGGAVETNNAKKLLDEIADTRIAASQKVARVNSRNGKFEMLGLIAATLQWGFGDLLVCMLRTRAIGMCS